MISHKYKESRDKAKYITGQILSEDRGLLSAGIIYGSKKDD